MSSSDDDTQPSTATMPPQPKTKEIPAVSPVEVMLAQLTRIVELGNRELRADVGLISNDLHIVKERVGILEAARSDFDARASRTSLKVEQASKHDLETDAQLAQERMAREALASKVDALTTSQEVQLAILGRLDKLATNPHVKLILAVVATALMSWAASKGLK